jgi:hypothetical protein
VCLLIYRGVKIRNKPQKTPPPFSFAVVLFPFIVSLVYAIILPILTQVNLVSEQEEFQLSNKSSSDWLSERSVNKRYKMTTSTSIFCACIIAGSGILNTQLTLHFARVRSKLA